MKYLILLAYFLTSLTFLSVISGHPTCTHCPCGCGSSIGTHSLTLPRPGQVNMQQPAGPMTTSPIQYEAYHVPPRIVTQTPAQSVPSAINYAPCGPTGITYDYSILPSNTVSNSQSTSSQQLLPIGIQIPADSVLPQTQGVEVSAPIYQSYVLDNIPTSYNSNKQTGGMLKYHYEPPVIPASNEMKFDTYNSGPQFIQEPVQPVITTIEQEMPSSYIIESQPAITTQVSAPYQSTQYVAEVQSPVVSRAGFVGKPKSNLMFDKFLHQHGSNCGCFN